VGKRGEVPCVGSYVHYQRTDSNDMPSASKEEEGPHKRSWCQVLAFPRLGGGLGPDPWVERLICVLGEGTNISPPHLLRRTGIPVGKSFATRTDCYFRPEHDPVQFLCLGRQTCLCCACWALFWRIRAVSAVGRAGRTLPFSV
jgi:hypothetical protein